MFTNGTTNYNLPQWLPQDKPTWLGDMNGAFLTIDENLKSVSDTATTASNAAANALTQIGTDDISSIGSNIKNAIINLNNLIGAWTSQLGSDIATAIATIQQQITTINSTIGTWTSQIGTNIASAITTLKSKVSTIETTIGTWSTSIGTNIASAITTLKDDNEYSDGTQTIITAEESCQGMITYGGTRLAFTVILPKQIKDSKRITVNNFDIYIRNNDGYIKTNSGVDMTGFTKARIEEFATIQNITHAGQLLRFYILFNEQIKKPNGDLISVAVSCGVSIGNINITIA